MKEKNEKPEFQKEIEERMTTSFTISNIPSQTFSWFKEFCLKETRDNYAVGIRMLKSYYDFYNQLEPLLAMLTRQINDLNERLDRLEAKPAEKSKSKIRTMGDQDGN